MVVLEDNLALHPILSVIRNKFLISVHFQTLEVIGQNCARSQ